ncbi:hypothetical protein WMY93_021056 [Mugilogobius chulae]|uniref:MAM domain-containing protein n=1 Tax=Mugilogobius chulae TaxID=88201 RepID=A0AAW0NDV9_9GOBI
MSLEEMLLVLLLLGAAQARLMIHTHHNILHFPPNSALSVHYHATVSGPAPGPAPGSCSFDSHTCGYTWDPDYSPWSLHSEGHFIAVESDLGRADIVEDVPQTPVQSGGARGVLLSPLLELDEWSCLRLVYQVSVEGNLDVLLRSEARASTNRCGTPKKRLKAGSSPVVIDGTSGGAAGSSVSLFEIHVSPGYCLECSFEESHLCGYSNQWNANVNWYVGGGAVQLLDDDHASHNSTGHFMYVDSLHAVTFQEVAKLLSPMTTAPMSGCLSFQYQRSEALGNLFSVYTRDRLGQYQELWRAAPESQGPGEWETVQVDLKAPYALQVVFEVAFSSPRGGRVAVDDVSFSPQFCSADTEPTFDPSVGTCDFEEGLCGYVQGHGAPWRRVTVKPNIFRTGDHTTGAGSFLLAHSLLGHRSGYVSRLMGPSLPGNTEFCLMFYFTLRGFNQTEQALSVYLQQGLVQHKIWTQAEKSRGIWIQGDVSFTTSSPSKVVFVSMCKSLWDCGSVAMDDITLDLGHCELNTGRLSVPAQCDFESGFCGYSQDRHSDDTDWYRRRGPTPTSYTGTHRASPRQGVSTHLARRYSHHPPGPPTSTGLGTLTPPLSAPGARYSHTPLHRAGYSHTPLHRAGYSLTPLHRARYSHTPLHRARYSHTPLHRARYSHTPLHRAGTLTHLCTGLGTLTHLCTGLGTLTHLCTGLGTLTHLCTGLGTLTHLCTGLGTLTHLCTGLGTLTHLCTGLGLGTLSHLCTGLGTLTHLCTGLGTLSHLCTGLGTLTHFCTGLGTLTHFCTGLGTLTHLCTGLGTLTHLCTGLGTLTHFCTGLGTLTHLCTGLGTLTHLCTGLGTPTQTPKKENLYAGGYYAYLEASPLLPGHAARLRSSSLRGSWGPQCLLFHYHMYGSGTGRLSVHVDEGGEVLSVWEREGEQSMGWLRAHVQYHSDKLHQVCAQCVGQRRGAECVLLRAHVQYHSCIVAIS